MTAPDSSALSKDRIHDFVSTGVFSDPKAEEGAVSALLNEVPLEDLFGLVSSFAEDPEFQTTVLNAVSRVFLSPKGSERLATSASSLALGLDHSSNGAPSRVREATAALLRKVAGKDATSAETLLKSVPMVDALVAAVSDENMTVARDAAEALSTGVRLLPGCGTPALVDSGVASNVVGRALAASSKPSVRDDSILQVRYADLLIKLATADGGLFAACAEQGALDLLPAMVMSSGDQLVQLTAMDEVMRALTSQRQHVAWLFRSGLADWLLDQQDDPLLSGAALTLIGRMFATAYRPHQEGGTPEGGEGGGGASSSVPQEASALTSGGAATSSVRNVTPALLLRFLRCAAALGDDPRDEARQLAAVDATSHFAAASRSNLALVLQDPQLTRSWLTLPARINQKAAVLHSVATVLAPLEVGPALSQPPFHPENPAAAVAQPPEVASAAATTAAAAATAREVLTAPNSQPQQQPVSAAAAEAAKKLFEGLGRANGEDSTMALLMQLLRSPIEELRHGAYDVLRGAAACPPSDGGWALAAMDAFGGFFEYAENRFTENTKQGKEWKFSLMEALAANPYVASGSVGPARLSKLREMLREGPFYVPYRPEGPETAD